MVHARDMCLRVRVRMLRRHIFSAFAIACAVRSFRLPYPQPRCGSCCATQNLPPGTKGSDPSAVMTQMAAMTQA